MFRPIALRYSPLVYNITGTFALATTFRPPGSLEVVHIWLRKEVDNAAFQPRKSS